ncbi:MAG: DNA mismatch repair endonuclease MutL [Bacteroidaceae bacterium]|nr:DNA mismatch repair endonuclease MutL [Bacteroidaceae bacterium]
MQDIIHLLPDSVANQIAAGEVVQRPSSVVKELMENAIDAGATKVQVLVNDGGRTLIQVIDNGVGMSETDARLAFERHATSKIRKAEDLFALNTMGFRGEALASIVAVAQVELITRRADDELGTQIVFSGSELQSQDVVAAPVGSNFKVKNLFFNIPARRKFLKSTQTELNNIVAEFERVALINCDVEFLLMHNGVEILQLPVSSFRQRIVNIFGKKINTHLVEVSVDSTLIRIKGFVGAPESARKKGVLQYFFVNGRYMRHSYFAKAVQEAFVNIVPAGEQVPFFLCLNVEPSRIDVNIHPTKTEIKFEDEPSLWKIILAAVRESLGRFNVAPGLDFGSEDIPEIPTMDFSAGEERASVSAPKVTYDPTYNPFKKVAPEYRKTDNSYWEKLYEGVEKYPGDIQEPAKVNQFEEFVAPCNDTLNELHSQGGFVAEPLVQYKGQYILVAKDSGLMWIHQRRAHIRVLFEKYRKQLYDKRGAIQGLLFPERVELSVTESLTLETIMDELSYLGFDISSLGGGTFALQGVPAGLDGLNPVTLLTEVVRSVLEQPTDAKEKLYEKLALSMAKQMAVVVGQVLQHEEMCVLVNELFATELPLHTPDGALIVYTISDSEIARFFAKK